MTRRTAAVLACAALALGACAGGAIENTTGKTMELIEFSRDDVKRDIGEHTGGLTGRDYQWRESKEAAAVTALCADIGISETDDMFAQCAQFVAGTPNHMSYDEFRPPQEPLRWFYLTDFVNNQWFAYRAYRAAYVKKSHDRDTHWNLQQGFLEKQRQLLQEREAMGAAYDVGDM